MVLADNHTQAELDGLVSARGTGEGALLVCDARWNAAPERVEQVAAAANDVEPAQP